MDEDNDFDDCRSLYEDPNRMSDWDAYIPDQPMPEDEGDW